MMTFHRGRGDRMCQSTGATSDALVELDFDDNLREAEPCSVPKPWTLSRGSQ